MSLIETRGIIIKAQDYKENDKLLWIFTEKLGKITVIAKGAKKNKSKLFSVTLPLCYGDYLFFKGRNLYTLSEGKIINSFQGLLNDLIKLTYSSYICELVDICAEEEKNNYLYREVLTCLYLMNTDAIDYELLIRAFELKLLKATGYDINFNSCSICKKKIDTSNYISLSNFGGVCESCNKEHGFYINKASYNALRFLKDTPMEKVYRLNASKEMKDEMSKVTSFLISSNYVKSPKSLEMLKFIKE